VPGDRTLRRSRRVLAVTVALGVVVLTVVAVGVGTGGGGSRGGGSGSGGSGSGGRGPGAATAAPGATDPGATGPGTTGPGTTGPGTTGPGTGAPTPAEVAAARACQAFSVYLEDASAGRVPAAVGTAVVRTASVLLRGARQDQAAGRPLPPWAPLGVAILAAAQDVVAHDEKALRTDGAEAGASCRSLPAAAARAGGFERSEAVPG
jgi:hypothetical protein